MESPTDGRKFPEHGRGRPVWPAAILLLTTVAAIVLAASLEYYLRPKPKPPHASTGIFDFYDYYQHGASLEQAAGRRAVTGAVIGLIVGIVVALRRQCWPAGLVLALFLHGAGGVGGRAPGRAPQLARRPGRRGRAAGPGDRGAGPFKRSQKLEPRS